MCTVRVRTILHRPPSQHDVRWTTNQHANYHCQPPRRQKTYLTESKHLHRDSVHFGVMGTGKNKIMTTVRLERTPLSRLRSSVKNLNVAP